MGVASTGGLFFVAGSRGSSKISLRPHTSRTRAGTRLYYYSLQLPLPLQHLAGPGLRQQETPAGGGDIGAGLGIRLRAAAQHRTYKGRARPADRGREDRG